MLDPGTDFCTGDKNQSDVCNINVICPSKYLSKSVSTDFYRL